MPPVRLPRKRMHVPPKHASNTWHKYASDRTVFLMNLNNYIALGSLSFCPDLVDEALLEHATEQLDHDTWRDWFYGLNHKGTHEPAYLANVLAASDWIRIHARRTKGSESLATARIYVLPDDVGRLYVDRDDVHLRKALARLVNQLDISPDAWEGCENTHVLMEHYKSSSTLDDSLFYIFNTLPSPSAQLPAVSCPISREAIYSVFNSNKMPGIKTILYPYQKRSVATMIKREVEPAKALDPRLEQLRGPTGATFFYDRETGVLLRDQRDYEDCRGGMLAESMGLGKTLICLSTIVATKGHWPRIPPEFSLDLHPIRTRVGSLMQMSAAAVGLAQIPWRALFHDLALSGEDHANCVALLEQNVCSYIIPAPATRRSRRPTVIPKGKTVRLSTATLIIVPQNLLNQWKREIAFHLEQHCLNILCLDSAEKAPLPSALTLLKYDVILLTRQRFEREMVPSESFRAHAKSRGGCRCSLDDDCHCSRNEEYESPLKDLHFLRIIMDEGHEFSASGRKGTIYWALQKLHVDRKWIISGTPASGLFGVEVGNATCETCEDALQVRHGDLLEARRKESACSQERRDLEKLGLIVTGFLQLKPWANSKDEDCASWQKYIMPYDDGRRKVKSLKALLESLVVRHRIEDVEADIHLPPLHNQVIYLQPCWHDKLSINLFILTLAANAVTSERTDEDYMFHTRNRRPLNLLIANLRQSGFYWTSFVPEDITQTVKVSQAYLDKQPSPSSGCSEMDRRLLQQAIETGDIAVNSATWRSIANLHEMGMYVERFPDEACHAWSMIPARDDKSINSPLLIGASQLIKAQTWADSHLYESDPVQSLTTLGTSTMQKLWQTVSRQAAEAIPDSPGAEKDKHKGRVPKKQPGIEVRGAPKLTEKQTVSRAKAGLNPRGSEDTQFPQKDRGDCGRSSKIGGPKPILKSALRISAPNNAPGIIPSDSPLAGSKIIGTASAKLSYLLDQVTALHQHEKTLIFYDGDHIAYYIAQAFDLLGIRYLIYTRTLSLARQNAYITTFNTTETFRVLLMNIHQAAHGLHIASASRVFFVNPVWQPNVEAQAIKRAHRIGQTRPVYVETLVLKDTLEDHMLQRRKGMTAQEHQKAEKSLLDDDTMSTIIKNARFIPILQEEIDGVSDQVARLLTPQQLFGRTGKGDGAVDDPDADLLFPAETPQLAKTNRKRKTESEHTFDSTVLRPPNNDLSSMQGTEGSGSVIPTKRVAFNVSGSNDEPSSLFGGSPSTSSIPFPT